MFIRSGYSAHTRRVRAPSVAPFASDTEHHHDAADVLVGCRHLAPPQRVKADLAPLALQLTRAHAIQLDQVSFALDIGLAQPLRRTAGRVRAIVDHPALAFDHDRMRELCLLYTS